jgi:hypothetical protein
MEWYDTPIESFVVEGIGDLLDILLRKCGYRIELYLFAKERVDLISRIAK